MRFSKEMKTRVLADLLPESEFVQRNEVRLCLNYSRNIIW